MFPLKNLARKGLTILNLNLSADLVVIVEGIKEETKTIPLVCATEHGTLGHHSRCVPDSLQGNKQKGNKYEYVNN